MHSAVAMFRIWFGKIHRPMTPEASFARRVASGLAPMSRPNTQSPSGVSATASISTNGMRPMRK
jgi:hypothetical protein